MIAPRPSVKFTANSANVRTLWTRFVARWTRTGDNFACAHRSKAARLLDEAPGAGSLRIRLFEVESNLGPVGRGAILNTACSVDHDYVIGDGAHIGPGVRLCGNVTVGARSLIGVGSAVRPRVTVGSDVVVGAGSAVVADIPDGSVVAGCPARRL